jgi:agarase
MPVQVPKTRWGGIADGRFRPAEFFRVGQCDGVFWLVDPDGGRFLSKGLNTVRFDQDTIQNSDRIPYAEACRNKYGNESAWRTAAASRLASWGVNTLGSWSDEAVATASPLALAVTPNLDLGMSFAWWKNDQTLGERKQDFPDVFDPEFGTHIGRRARELCAKRIGEQDIIGWFIDNELRWGPDWRGADELLTLFLNLSAKSPGRFAAIAWLRERHRTFEEFNSSWRIPARSWDELIAATRIEPPYRRKPPYERDARNEDAANRADPGRGVFAADCDVFAALLAKRYFESTTAAIKAADPYHLVLGCRFAYPPPAAVIDAAARQVDVISFNCYGLDADGAIDAYAVTGKPCLIGEFSFRAADSGLPNSIGAGPQVASQTERAAAFRHYVTAALQKPTVVGYHWFEHADEPAEGRFDGENSNYGTVTIDDRVYEELTRTMASVNAEAEDLHAAAVDAAT